MKKFLCLFFAIITVFAVTISVSAETFNNPEEEIELALDNSRNAGVTFGYAVFDHGIYYYNLDNMQEKAVFESIQNRSNFRSTQVKSLGSFHVGIEMVGSQYRMYYEARGVGLVSVGGYMKCKSTALILPKTYHDEKFVQKSVGTTFMSGESSLFSLPAGTEKVKVGWHDVTVQDGDGYAEPGDGYVTVNVG